VRILFDDELIKSDVAKNKIDSTETKS